jgi:hypothetical protein
MSNTPVLESRPRARSRRRRLRWVIVGLVAALAVGAGVYVYVEYGRDWDVLDAIAEADRLDPGWRFQEMEAARAAVPEAENGAALVLAARALMPPNWLAPPPNNAPFFADRLADLPPLERPDEADLNQLRVELAKVAAALEKARQLADRPLGRYAVAWSQDLIGTLVPHLQQAREVARMLTLDALLRAQDGEMEEAMQSCRAALNAGRSIGDEPMHISQLVRTACTTDAVRALERTLATGTVSPRTLEEMQQLLALEAEEPLQLIAARADRVSFFEFLDLMRTGRFNRAAYKLKPSILGSTGDDLIDRGQARACEAAYLRYCTALVEIAKLPTETQEEQFNKLAAPTHRLPMLLDGLTKGIDWAKQARRFHRAQAELRCAAAALAAERHRLAEGRWPDRLDALVPRYLAAVPADPFDGQPIRLRRLVGGLVVYSVGPDRIDDGGNLNRMQPGQPGTDIGFQLWDIDQRNLPR